MDTIFLLEDDQTLGRGIVMALEAPGRTVTLAGTLQEGRALLGRECFDLLILDINLPDGSGLELLRQLRAAGNGTPVILLTANDLELDEVTGLEAGADDYITKPFSLAVLRARVAAQLRRRAQPAAGAVTMGPFVFDFDRMVFYRAGAAIELSKAEQRLLRVLVENQGHTVPRVLLMEKLWPDGTEYVEENALSVTVRRLRGKLEADPANPQYLKTVYGLGYTWVVQP